MSIEELTKRRNEYCNTKYNRKWEAKISGFMTEVINTFKSQSNEITKLRGKVKKLEQEGSYYPSTEKEIRNIKVGGND